MNKRILFPVVFICCICIRVIQCYDGAPCYTGPPEYCPTPDSPPDFCKCKNFGQSLFCCQVQSNEDLLAHIKCSRTNSAISLGSIRGLHIYNMTADRFNLGTMVPQDLNSLMSLSITNSYIKHIRGHFELMNNINCLNLSNNVFGTEWEDPYIFKHLQKLTMLDFSNVNMIKKLPKIEIQVPRFWLDVSNNQKMECQTLFDLMASVRSTPPDRKIHWINYNETFCMDALSFHWFNSTEKISLSQVEIINKLKVDCPKFCNCSWHGYAMVQDTNTLRTVEVDCSNKNLENLPSNLPENTVLLNVTNNNITELGTFVLDQTYQTLKYLYADHNKISNLLPLEASPFIANYLVLSLKYNQVKQLPIYLLENSFVRDFVGNRVYLGGNEFQCKCESIPLKAWLNSNRHHILDIEDILCENFNYEVKLMQLDPKLVCVTNPDWTDQMHYVIAAELSLLLLLIGKVSYDYWVFKTAGYLPWPASKMPKLPCDWLFE